MKTLENPLCESPKIDMSDTVSFTYAQINLTQFFIWLESQKHNDVRTYDDDKRAVNELIDKIINKLTEN